jgi:hypothetical protein
MARQAREIWKKLEYELVLRKSGLDKTRSYKPSPYRKNTYPFVSSHGLIGRFSFLSEPEIYSSTTTTMLLWTSRLEDHLVSNDHAIYCNEDEGYSQVSYRARLNEVKFDWQSDVLEHPPSRRQSSTSQC